MLKITYMPHKQGEGGEEGIFCLHFSPMSVHIFRNFWEIYPNFTILASRDLSRETTAVLYTVQVYSSSFPNKRAYFLLQVIQFKNIIISEREVW